MTGDGVNDAPALREAHIASRWARRHGGYARSLGHDPDGHNFASIVAAVREGRACTTTFEDARVPARRQLGRADGDAERVAGGPAVASAPAATAVDQLVTDGLPALALVADPPDADVLTRPPRKADEAMLGRVEWRLIISPSHPDSRDARVFVWALRAPTSKRHAARLYCARVRRIVPRLRLAQHCRHFWEVGLRSNLALLCDRRLESVQIAIHHIPFTQKLFGLGTISLRTARCRWRSADSFVCRRDLQALDAAETENDKLTKLLAERRC